MAFRFQDPTKITPKEFESAVHCWFKSFPESLDEFDAQLLETHFGADGDYEIDVTIRFTAFGGSEFLVLCECKKHTNPIERGLVQILNDKKRSLNAHKAIMVTTSSYQSGARDYAKVNRIGLIEITSGAYAYITNSAGNFMPQIPDDADPYCGVINMELAVPKRGENRDENTPTIDFPMRLTSWDTMQLEEFLKSE